MDQLIASSKEMLKRAEVLYQEVVNKGEQLREMRRDSAKIWREIDKIRACMEKKEICGTVDTNSTAMVISETRMSSKKHEVKVPLGQTWQEDASKLDELQATWKEELASAPKEIIMVKYVEIQQAITKKYRELAMRYHPDKNPGQQKEQSEAIFKEACNTIDAIREELQGVLKRRNSDKDLSDEDWRDIQNWDADYSQRIEILLQNCEELTRFWDNHLEEIKELLKEYKAVHQKVDAMGEECTKMWIEIDKIRAYREQQDTGRTADTNSRSDTIENGLGDGVKKDTPDDIRIPDEETSEGNLASEMSIFPEPTSPQSPSLKSY